MESPAVPALLPLPALLFTGMSMVLALAYAMVSFAG